MPEQLELSARPAPGDRERRGRRRRAGPYRLEPVLGTARERLSRAPEFAAGLLVTVLATYLASRQPALGVLAGAGLAAVPACLARPDLVALAVVPVSVLAGRSP